jgi:hypothetical protein
MCSCPESVPHASSRERPSTHNLCRVVENGGKRNAHGGTHGGTGRNQVGGCSPIRKDGASLGASPPGCCAFVDVYYLGRMHRCGKRFKVNRSNHGSISAKSLRSEFWKHSSWQAKHSNGYHLQLGNRFTHHHAGHGFQCAIYG